jgi:hypothetical protein
MFNVIDMRNGSSNQLSWNTSRNGDWHLEANTSTLYYLGMYSSCRSDYFYPMLTDGKICLVDKCIVQYPVLEGLNKYLLNENTEH